MDSRGQAWVFCGLDGVVGVLRRQRLSPRLTRGRSLGALGRLELLELGPERDGPDHDRADHGQIPG